VAEYHTLPSPHPRLPLTKYFFFPGFTEATGGLLREGDLEQHRQAFAASPDAQENFLARLGVPDVAPSGSDTLLVSLFSYENAALADLLDAWSCGSRPVLCLAPPTRNLADLERFARRRLAVGDVVRAGRLELRIIPFVPQPDYDRLLWSCDLNFVRGEDSFVRAQWVARPMVWQIYPQAENIHHPNCPLSSTPTAPDCPTRRPPPCANSPSPGTASGRSRGNAGSAGWHIFRNGGVTPKNGKKTDKTAGFVFPPGAILPIRAIMRLIFYRCRRNLSRNSTHL
jgi:Uncharacterized protein conserved in bacteria